MNPIVKEYANTAALYASEVTGLKKGQLVTKAWIDIYESKFAELILEKVFDICYNNDSLADNSAGILTAQQILKFFYDEESIHSY